MIEQLSESHLEEWASVRLDRRNAPSDGNSHRWAVLLLTVSVAVFWLMSHHGPPAPKTAQQSHSSVKSAAAFPREKIENLRVGQRVVASLSNATDSYPTSVDQKTWRLLKLQGEWRWADGTQDVIQVESLQPPDWIRDHGAEVGALVPFPLDLLEMGVPEGLLARVVANESCPEIKPGKGRVILNTVNHLNNDVYELTVNNGNRTEVLRPTGLHKFYSETRQDWISTKNLQPNDSLSGINEPLRVVSVHSLPGTQRVYNITVEDEHVYRVSSLAALTHNNWCGPNAGMNDALKKFPNAKPVDIRRLSPPAGGRDFADPDRLRKLGAFDWGKMDSAIVIRLNKNGTTEIVNGMTRVEAALRAGVTHLPAEIVP